MALTIIEQTEYEENGYTYIRTEYSNGTIDVHIKSDTPAEPDEPVPAAVTNEDIMAKLEDMTTGQVSTATLDAAYQEGVNSYV